MNININARATVPVNVTATFALTEQDLHVLKLVGYHSCSVADTIAEQERGCENSEARPGVTRGEIQSTLSSLWKALTEAGYNTTPSLSTKN